MSGVRPSQIYVENLKSKANANPRVTQVYVEHIRSFTDDHPMRVTQTYIEHIYGFSVPVTWKPRTLIY